MRDRAKDHPKLHHEDPSGFWRLVRTGESLPEVGQQILFVYDIRGTADEAFHNVLAKIADNDPYRITNDRLEREGKVLGGAPGALLAETFKLPTTACQPSTHSGVVDEVGFDEVMHEHWIAIRTRATVWTRYFNPESIIYWAPYPAAPDTYTPRPDEFSHTSGLAAREQNTRDRWEARRLNRLNKENHDVL